ncbi:MAG: alpha-L-fucosidase [Dysgonamonadaceae bacterium]|jgi:alpha-L-fucosidase|nr:alpha-L-fucosidase [Dysgonamonadaceae bacterium]
MELLYKYNAGTSYGVSKRRQSKLCLSLETDLTFGKLPTCSANRSNAFWNRRDACWFSAEYVKRVNATVLRCIIKSFLCFILIVSPAVSSLFAEGNNDERMRWWRDARFGMFIHWGVYSVFANVYNGVDVYGEQVAYNMRNTMTPAEWIMRRALIPRDVYRRAALQFDASEYDPKLWVETAKNAGMKYIIITAKHHDGFCLFDSQHTEWDAVDASSAGRDLLAELVEEARKGGVKIGFYYSQNVDWMHEGGMDAIPELGLAMYSPEEVRSYVNNLVIPHFQELIDKYSPDVIWFDAPLVENVQEDLNLSILDAIRNSAIGDKVIFNNRLCVSVEYDFETPEFDTPDIPYNGYSDGRDWEACSSINNSWGYEGADIEYEWRSPLFMVSRVIELASKGGNFLLNVGPDPHGVIPEPAVNTLKSTGDWLKTNGEAVYGTEKNDLVNPFEFGYVTQRTESDGSFHWYLNISSGYWDEGAVHLYGIMERPVSANYLDGGAAADMQYHDNIVTINLPEVCPDQYYTTIDLKFDGKPSQKPQIQLRDSLIRLTPFQAEVSNGVRKDFVPYAIKEWYRRNNEVRFSLYLEAGYYTISSEYASINTGNFYFTIDGKDYQAAYRRTNFGDHTDLSKYTTETFPDLKIDIPVEGVYQLVVKRDAEIEGHFNIVNVRNFTLKKILAAGGGAKIDLLFPNPVVNGILSCPSCIGEEVTIYTVDGAKIKTVRPDDAGQINLKDLNTGLYIIKSGTFSSKIIINK